MTAKNREVYKYLNYNIKMNLLNGITFSIGYNMIMPFIGIFAIKLGANNYEVSLINSLPALMALIGILPATIFINKSKNVFKFAYILEYITRAFYLLVALVPFMSKFRPEAVVLFVGLLNLPAIVTGMCWQSFMSDLIPEEFRGKVFADRNIWTGLLGTASVFITGLLLDRIKFPYGYQIMFFIAFIFGILDSYYYSRFHYVADKKEKSILFIDSLKAIKQSKKFIYFSLASFIFTFTWMMAWPIFTIYKVDSLHANNMWMSISTIVGSVGSIITYKWWARLADRKGNGIALSISTLLIATIPALWAKVTSLFVGAVIDFYGGMATAGYTMLSLNWLLELLPDHKEKMNYIAIYTIITQFAAFLSPIFGTWLYEVIGYEVFMYVTTVLRVLSSVLFFSVAIYKGEKVLLSKGGV
ncbi:MFS transporter [Thermoanaerobacterium thermosaccharolyticum]|uniref:MFS transporter n=1 Tax=Thermoanaerobacterium thermosaccharolyticum TaxID=1517 RepID=UPI00123951C7|nr:MFS transporter [Thermoanaerobacterium thermosaccharolyticum]KAA5807301.1 MFS transporter [Thermoanaerobacterium thermosaccharolyticum]